MTMNGNKTEETSIKVANESISFSMSSETRRGEEPIPETHAERVVPKFGIYVEQERKRDQCQQDAAGKQQQFPAPQEYLFPTKTEEAAQ